MLLHAQTPSFLHFITPLLKALQAELGMFILQVTQRLFHSTVKV